MLDGNVAAGPLAEVLTVEATAASVTCATCSRTGAVATLRAYVDAPGTVLRCPGCSAVVMRMAEVPGRLLLDLSGVRVLELAR
jgi:hypothetical protein